MQTTVNKYGEIEVVGNEVQYSIPLAYADFDNLDDLETAYKQKGISLSPFKNYLFAHDLTLVTNRLVFTYDLQDMKSFYYLRQMYFEDQIYYFRSFIDLAKNNSNTPILWDKNNIFVDLTDGTIKALVFEFDGHRLYNIPPTLDGLKEVILLSLTSLFRVLGKPRLVDFIDQRDKVIRFAEQVLRASSIQEVERVLEETVVNVEREEEIRREYEEKLKGMKYLERRKEIHKNKAAGKFVAATSTEFAERSKRGLRSQNDVVQTISKKENQEEKQGFFSSKYFYLGSAGIAAVILIVNIFTPSDPDVKASPTEQVQEQKTEGKLSLSSEQVQEQKTEERLSLSSEQVADIYRKSIAGENKEALIILEQVGYENLVATEQKHMIQLYEKEGLYEKVLQLDPNQAESVVSKLIESKQTDKLKGLQSQFKELPPVNYEVAYMTSKYDTVIGLAGDIDLTDSVLADRRRNQLLVAYLWSGLNQEATKLAGEDTVMKERIIRFGESNQRIKELTNKISAAQNKNDDKQVIELKQKIENIKANLNRI
ncbi:hypothetical protein [Paenibacillus crassostreae]|uniref:Uncharacterized protein n=1 Tax=Paenibacillus crassostreae TaxID=1763538 RepID=A0A167EKI2_9BACL|nr:hypothetical protein [Paenibacillus crassostreae]AOZ94877.1 hypothetical protein LPB68_21680 [Paenibacillus crassostreae]OAB75632.1 hypothetical protein PNBC_08370 [Paenibacillus crassostreae]